MVPALLVVGTGVEDCRLVILPKNLASGLWVEGLEQWQDLRWQGVEEVVEETVENRILSVGEYRGHIEAVDRSHRVHWHGKSQCYW